MTAQMEAECLNLPNIDALKGRKILIKNKKETERKAGETQRDKCGVEEKGEKLQCENKSEGGGGGCAAAGGAEEAERDVKMIKKAHLYILKRKELSAPGSLGLCP